VSSNVNKLPHRDPDWEFFRKLAELREAETRAKCRCNAQSNPATGAKELVALVKERDSLPYAIQTCEELAQVIEQLWQTANPHSGESPYESLIERLAFQVVLHLHHISQEEVDGAKNMIDARVTETIV
jgi:hypothetical protein